MSSGNGAAGTLRERLARDQAERERAIEKLEGVEWDEITENHWNLPKGSKVELDAAGRPRAISIPDEEVTKADHPKPESGWPERLGTTAGMLIGRVDTPSRLLALAVLVGLAAFAMWLRWGR